MDWLNHFRNRPDIKLEQFKEERISELERRKIGYSISQFQRGESSEARDFLEKSRIFSIKSGRAAFYEESKLFIKEENYHSNLLKIFMMQMQIEAASDAWTDNVFRWLRSLGDIAWSSRVLLTAEILAQVYYPALKEATSSEMLHLICERIIADEDFHILFQTERIARVLQHRHKMVRTIQAISALVLFCGTTFVVWLEHQAVLSSSLTFWQYIKSSLGRYKFAMRQLGDCLNNKASLREQRLVT
jgi:hypothetical protein